MTKPKCDYFAEPSHLIFDSLYGHTTTSMMDEWDSYSIQTHRIPAAAGKWLNPCDQMINREMRRCFNKLQRSKVQSKINNIITAYYSISEETVLNSFNRCGLLKGDPQEILMNHVSEGWRCSKGREQQYLQMWDAYLTWVKTLFRSQDHYITKEFPLTSSDDALDGMYWTTYGRY
jgi:hypothetical protein